MLDYCMLPVYYSLFVCYRYSWAIALFGCCLEAASSVPLLEKKVSSPVSDVEDVIGDAAQVNANGFYGNNDLATYKHMMRREEDVLMQMEQQASVSAHRFSFSRSENEQAHVRPSDDVYTKAWPSETDQRGYRSSGAWSTKAAATYQSAWPAARNSISHSRLAASEGRVFPETYAHEKTSPKFYRKPKYHKVHVAPTSNQPSEVTIDVDRDAHSLLAARSGSAEVVTNTAGPLPAVNQPSAQSTSSGNAMANTFGLSNTSSTSSGSSSSSASSGGATNTINSTSSNGSNATLDSTVTIGGQTVIAAKGYPAGSAPATSNGTNAGAAQGSSSQTQESSAAARRAAWLSAQSSFANATRIMFNLTALGLDSSETIAQNLTTPLQDAIAQAVASTVVEIAPKHVHVHLLHNLSATSNDSVAFLEHTAMIVPRVLILVAVVPPLGVAAENVRETLDSVSNMSTILEVQMLGVPDVTKAVKGNLSIVVSPVQLMDPSSASSNATNKTIVSSNGGTPITARAQVNAPLASVKVTHGSTNQALSDNHRVTAQSGSGSGSKMSSDEDAQEDEGLSLGLVLAIVIVVCGVLLLVIAKVVLAPSQGKENHADIQQESQSGQDDLVGISQASETQKEELAGSPQDASEMDKEAKSSEDADDAGG